MGKAQFIAAICAFVVPLGFMTAPAWLHVGDNKVSPGIHTSR